MLRILVCSEFDLRQELARTVIGRQGIEVYRAANVDQARTLARSLDPQAILVDRDHPHAAAVLAGLREDPVTRRRSIALLARGDLDAAELEMLRLGANAILRLPPDAGWDDRLSKLLTVQARLEARLPVKISAETVPECGAEVRNLSAGGMLLEVHRPGLHVHDEISFRFKLEDGTVVDGRGRIVREAGPEAFGVEFVTMKDDSREAIRQFMRSARLG